MFQLNSYQKNAVREANDASIDQQNVITLKKLISYKRHANIIAQNFNNTITTFDVRIKDGNKAVTTNYSATELLNDKDTLSALSPEDAALVGFAACEDYCRRLTHIRQ